MAFSNWYTWSLWADTTAVEEGSGLEAIDVSEDTDPKTPGDVSKKRIRDEAAGYIKRVRRKITKQINKDINPKSFLLSNGLEETSSCSEQKVTLEQENRPVKQNVTESYSWDSLKKSDFKKRFKRGYKL